MAQPPSGKPDPRALLAQWKKRKAQVTPPGIPRRAAGTPVPATPGQARLWTLQQLHPQNGFYQYGHAFVLEGTLDVGYLADAIRELLQRHEVLRSSFRPDDAGNLFVTVSDVPDEILEEPPIDLDREATEAWLRDFYLRPYDLARDLPVRFAFTPIRADDARRTTVAVGMHHVIGDRGSFELLAHELWTIYAARAREQREELEAMPIQFGDYAVWRATKAPAAESLAYWDDVLTTEPGRAVLPAGPTQPRRYDFRGATHRAKLSPELSARLRAAARSYGVTPNVLFLAVFQVLQLRYGSPEDFAVGSPVSLRDRSELERTIGFLNETVVIRNAGSLDHGFSEFILSTRDRAQSALRHKDVPFDELTRRHWRRDGSEDNPFFRTMFVYNAAAPALPRLPDAQLHGRAVDLGTAKFDLTLFATDAGDYFELALEYATEVLDAATVERMAGHLQTLLAAVLDHPATPVGDLPLMTPAEADAVLRGFNETAAEVPAADHVLDLIEPHFTARPRALAAADGLRTLTWAELDRRSASLAGHLHIKGVTAGTVVALHHGRNVDFLVGLLGILRAGGAYLPLDPAYPSTRIDYMLNDSGCRHAVVESYDFGDYPGVETVRVRDVHAGADHRRTSTAPTDPAYLIYTSGSTGRAKGVVVEHRNLVASTTARLAYFRHHPGSFLLLSSFSFDSSVAGIFWTLVSGGKLVIPPARSEQDMAGLADLIATQRVTHTLLLPSLYQVLLEETDPARLASLRTVMVAGEACSATVVRRHFATLPAAELINEYGPTEGSVWCTAHRITPADATGGVPIGRPVPNVRNYVLDPRGRALPVGVQGELYLTGPQVTRGYHERPELTAERFPTIDPSASYAPSSGPEAGAGVIEEGAEGVTAQRAYRTGDRVSYRPDGLIDFHGRMDQQVKIRGHRVEPGEVARHLAALPAVREAAVIPHPAPGGGLQLIAYYLSDQPLSERGLRMDLQRELPVYFVPSRFVRLEEFPRLPNGKLDRSRLSPPDAAPPSPTSEAPTELPASPTEEVLAGIWSDVLGLPTIGRDDNYFDLGGDSLRSIRILTKARKAGLDLSPSYIFQYPTIRELAAVLDRRTTEGRPQATVDSTVVQLNRQAAGDPLFCIHSGGGHVFFYHPLAAALEGHHPVYAIQPTSLESGGEEVAGSIEEMAASYLQAIRAVKPEGPYHLLGTCFSNMVALEMVHQLRAAGEEVGEIFIADSGPGQLEPLPEVPARPIRNLLQQVADGNWRGIKRGVYRRFWHARWAVDKAVQGEEMETLHRTITSLNTIYQAYVRRPIDAPITLIRSSEFAEQEYKDFHLHDWRVLAPAGVRVHVTPATHLNLFASPQVTGLAKILRACLEASTVT